MCIFLYCRCEVGYGLVGVAVRVCQANGAWSDNAPICQSKPSQIPIEVTNCIYMFVHCLFYTTQTNSSFPPLPPPPPPSLSYLPVSVCSTLEAPQNGNIVTTSTQFGGRATYSCVEGYRLVGTATRVCQSSGFWSGSAPFCSSKSITS